MTAGSDCRRSAGWAGILLALACACALPPLAGFLAVPFFLGRERRYSFCFLIVSIAAISSFYIPIADQNDYFNLLLAWSYPSYGFADFLDDATLREFNVVHISLYLFAKIGGTLELFRAILVAAAAVFCVDVADRMAYRGEEGACDRMNDILFFSILMALPLFSVFTGFRYGFATIVYVWGIVRFEREGSVRCLAASVLLTGCIHFGVSIYWLFYFLVKVVPYVGRFFSDRWRFAALLAGSLVFKFAVNSVFDVVEGGLGDGFVAQRVGAYLSSDAYFNREFLEDITPNTRLFYTLFASTLFMQVPFLWFGWDDVGEKTRNVLHLLSVLVCFGVLMSSNVTMLNRTASLSAPLFAVVIGDALSARGLGGRRVMRNCFVLLCSIVFVLPIARMKKSWFRSDVKKSCYTPSVMCLMNHYDEDWVDDNIEERALIE